MMACLRGFQSAAVGDEEGGATGLDPDVQQKLDARLAECISMNQEEQQESETQRIMEEQKRLQMERMLQEQQSSVPSSRGTLPDYCSHFTTIPSCSDAGSVDSENYKYCKECYPEK